MTYKELLETLKTFSKEELELDVSILDPHLEEYYELSAVGKIDEEDQVLDVGHPFLQMRT